MFVYILLVYLNKNKKYLFHYYSFNMVQTLEFTDFYNEILKNYKMNTTNNDSDLIT